MIVALALAAVLAQAAPPGRVHLAAGALSLDAPADATLKMVAPQTWELHDRDLTLGLVVGPNIADADDGEPRRCYATEIVLLDGSAAVLRMTRPAALADCPQGYASLYRPAGRRPALFVWAWDAGSDGAATLRAVIRSIRLDAEP